MGNSHSPCPRLAGGWISASTICKKFGCATLFEVLDINYNGSFKQLTEKEQDARIKQAWKKQASKVHPDKARESSDAAEKFKMLTLANDALSSRNLRDYYIKHGQIHPTVTGVAPEEEVGAASSRDGGGKADESDEAKARRWLHHMDSIAASTERDIESESVDKLLRILHRVKGNLFELVLQYGTRGDPHAQILRLAEKVGNEMSKSTYVKAYNACIQQAKAHCSRHTPCVAMATVQAEDLERATRQREEEVRMAVIVLKRKREREEAAATARESQMTPTDDQASLDEVRFLGNQIEMIRENCNYSEEKKRRLIEQLQKELAKAITDSNLREQAKLLESGAAAGAKSEPSHCHECLKRKKEDGQASHCHVCLKRKREDGQASQ